MEGEIKIKQFDMGSQEGLCLYIDGRDHCSVYQVVDDPDVMFQNKVDAFRNVLWWFENHTDEGDLI